MADSDLVSLTEDTTPGSDSIIYTVDDPAGTPLDRKATLSNITKGLAAASTTAQGAVELATTAETTTGTDATRAVTPDGLQDGYQGSANVTTLGTITTGVWNGTAIDGAYVDIEGTEIKSTGEVGGTKFLREDGDGTTSWQTIAGGGDMLASTYDTDADGVVDFAEATSTVVQNETGGTLTKGTAVYVSGFDTPSSLPAVSKARSDSASTMPAYGLVAADITTGNSGQIILTGELGGVDTSAYSVGDALYVDPSTAGNLTNTKPVGANKIQSIGKVTRAHISAGRIQVFGAGRSNDIPNFTAADKFWYGGTSGVATEGDITAAGRAILDDADAAAQRTTLGVDAAGTDNSTNVTLAGTNTYLTLSGQEITRGDIPVSALADGTDGELITWDAAGAPTTVATGTSGHVLTSNGAGTAPTFQAAAGGGQTLYDHVLAPSGGDYTDFSTALAAMSAGETLFVRSGTYTESGADISSSLSNITIIGENRDTSVIDFSGLTTQMTFSGTDVVFTNIHFESSDRGIKFEGARSGMDNCYITLQGGDSNEIWLQGANNFLQNSMIIDTGAANSGRIKLQGAGSVMTGNRITSTNGPDSTTIGYVHINASSYGIVSSNSFVFSGQNGGAIITADEGIISDNYIDAGGTTNSYGIQLDSGAIATGNYIRNCEYGMLMDGGSMATGNKFIYTGAANAGARGVQCKTGDVVTGNIFQGITTSGTIGVELTGTNAVVSGNMIYNWDVGVKMVAGDNNNTIIGNALRGNTTDISDAGTSNLYQTATDSDPLNDTA